MFRRIAMWSGPRNVSTALMRSFGARPDTLVSDEPLYAAYLQRTGKAHPLAAEIMATHECDWRRVARELTSFAPPGKSIWYQKHMAHHLLPHMERQWLESLTHAFLIREPRAMLASLTRKLSDVTLEDTGLPQQVELFRSIGRRAGVTPPVVDSHDLLLDPRAVLFRLCEQLEIPFEEKMLTWKSGPRDTDGCWGDYWYENTRASTGFTAPVQRAVSLSPQHSELCARCEELYFELAEHRIRAPKGNP
jgi:hypothetical protein